jgi:hypothetical protein
VVSARTRANAGERHQKKLGEESAALFLGFTKGQPLHVVAAFDEKAKVCLIVTAYRPDPEHFEVDYKTRRAQ